MESRIYPAWDVILSSKSQLTEGERTLLTYLDDHLPRSWQIFSQPHLNGLRPDVVVFNPNVGVMIFEVKDWDLQSYRRSMNEDLSNKEVLLVYGKRGELQEIKSPLAQVDYYVKKLIEQLLPQVGEKVDSDSKAFGVVKRGVYFHNANSEEVRRLFPDTDERHTPMLGNDCLRADAIEMVVPDARRLASKYWQDAWNEEVLHWLRPPYHTIEQARTLPLTARQRDHAAPRKGHSRLRGPAGSGKSLVIAYRAGQLAAQGRSVLILTFNITLWHYLRDLIQRTPFNFDWSKITFNHFHGFCGDVLNQAGMKWPQLCDDSDSAREKFFREDVVAAVASAASQCAHVKWDAVMIDEGQDYCWEWYDLLSNKFITDHNELLLVCDNNQNVYGRETSWIEGAMRNVQFQGRWRELDGSHRMSTPVANEVSRFAREFGLSDAVVIESSHQPEQGDFLGRLFDPQVIWIDRTGQEQERQMPEFLWSVYAALKRRMYSPSDVTFLLPAHDLGSSVVQVFELHNVGVNHVFDTEGKGSGKRHKKSFWNGDGRVKMSTIQSFKGWEAQCVVLVIEDRIAKEAEIRDMAVYTAMSRARETLIVVNTSQRYVDFGASLPQHWSQ